MEAIHVFNCNACSAITPNTPACAHCAGCDRRWCPNCSGAAERFRYHNTHMCTECFVTLAREPTPRELLAYTLARAGLDRDTMASDLQQTDAFQFQIMRYRCVHNHAGTACGGAACTELGKTRATGDRGTCCLALAGRQCGGCVSVVAAEKKKRKAIVHGATETRIANLISVTEARIDGSAVVDIAPISMGVCMGSYPCYGHAGVTLTLEGNRGEVDVECNSIDIAALIKYYKPHAQHPHFKRYAINIDVAALAPRKKKRMQ